MTTARFRPIIEPVRDTLSGLEKTLNAVVDAHVVQLSLSIRITATFPALGSQ